MHPGQMPTITDLEVHSRILRLEKEIINSKPFQRLRNIRQLAFTDYVYPGATHTRFSHSLGVMEFATKIFDILVRKQSDVIKERFGWNNDDDFHKHRQLLRLSALLHDVGHAPFSHASESLFMDKSKDKKLAHEDYSVKIIQDTEIGDIIDGYSEIYGIEKQHVADMISGEALGKDISLRDIISGQIDADRIDYLVRDSIYCGVDYGRFDYQRLIHTLTIVPELPEGGGNLAVEEGGVHAVEGLILARYFMFTQVYFHRVRHAYDIHLGDALKEILPDGCFPEETNEYIKWDDLKVISQMRKRKESEFAFRILGRKHFREIYKTGEHIGVPEQKVCYLVSKQVKDRFGEEKVRMVKAQTSLHKFDKVNLFIKTEDGYVPIGECSRILKDFNQPITQMRILTDKSIEEKAKAFCRSIDEEFRKS